MARRIILGTGFVAHAFGGVMVSRSHLDYTHPLAFDRFLKLERPDVIINCAGFTGRPNIDQCEVERAETLRANLLLPAMLSRVCEDNGVTFVHISSGCIYEGDNAGMGWRESDTPAPLSFYSHVKALAEEVVKGYIIRIRMPFVDGSNQRDLLNKLLGYPKLISEENSLTYLPDMVAAVNSLLDANAPQGVYNVVNEGVITHRKIVEIFNDVGISWKPQFIDEFEFQGMVRAPRSNCVLNIGKLSRYHTMPSVYMRVRTAALNYPGYLRNVA